MSLLDYGEDRLIEQPTIALFRELGGQTIDCIAESQTGPQSDLSGRETCNLQSAHLISGAVSVEGLSREELIEE